MTTEIDKAPEVAPLTLAELVALSTVLQPGNAIVGIIAALVPLYAIRSAQTIEQVWAADAMAAVDGILTALPSAITEGKFKATLAAIPKISAAFAPGNLLQRFTL
jgi:hypothetical protein